MIDIVRGFRRSLRRDLERSLELLLPRVVGVMFLLRSVLYALRVFVTRASLLLPFGCLVSLNLSPL